MVTLKTRIYNFSIWALEALINLRIGTLTPGKIQTVSFRIYENDMSQKHNQSFFSSMLGIDEDSLQMGLLQQNIYEA